MLYHWQAQGLEMFVSADDAAAARIAILAELVARHWQHPARYDRAIEDIHIHPPAAESLPGQVLMVDVAMWTTPKRYDRSARFGARPKQKAANA